MLKKALTACALAGSIALLSGCVTGPNQYSRTWDDWVNQKYTEDAYIHGVLLQQIIPIYGLVGFVMGVVDVVAINTYTFWTKDVWDGKGTGFDHENPSGASKTVNAAF